MMRFLSFLFLLCSFSVFAQSTQENINARAEFILQFTKTKYLTWPKRSRKNFEITILKDSALFEQVKAKTPAKTMFGRNTKVQIVQQLSAISEGSDLIYLNSSDGFKMTEVISRYSGKPVLIVGENYP